MNDLSNILITQRELTSGLTFYQRADGIFVFTFMDMSRNTVEAWAAQSAKNDAQALAAGKHIRSIYTIRGQWVISPYLVSIAIRESERTAPDLIESVAVVSHKLAVTIIAGVIRRLTPKARQSVAMFVREEDAIEWLDERAKQFGVEVYTCEKSIGT